MDPARLEEAIQTIATWFQGEYESPSGFPWAEIDGETGRPLGHRDLSTELDDYLALLRQAGYPDYADRQVTRLVELWESRGGNPYDRPQTRVSAGLRFRLPLLRSPRYRDLLDLTEILFGLVESHRAGGCCGELELAETIARGLLGDFQRSGELRSWRWLAPGWTLPLAEPLAGMILEGLCDLAGETRQDRWLEPARRTADAWLGDPLFQRWGAFPTARLLGPLGGLVSRRIGAARRFELVKGNTSMAWGLLALHRTDGHPRWAEGLERWLAGLDGVFSGDGTLCRQLGYPGEPTGPGLILSTNFAVIDLLCDLAAAEPRWRSWLDRAADMAESWISLRWDQTGLLPDEREGTRSYVDGNSDLAVAMLRLGELTGRKEFRQEAERTVQAVLEHHRSPHGFWRDVDGITGRPLGHLVETRFVSLLLKPLLILARDLKIYGPGGVAGLVRDR